LRKLKVNEKVIKRLIDALAKAFASSLLVDNAADQVNDLSADCLPIVLVLEVY
jgi:hypothetical protein